MLLLIRIALRMIGSFFFGKPEHAGDLFVGGRSAQFFAQPRRGTPPFAQQFHHVGGNANRLGAVDQCPLDRLLDPVTRIGAESRSDGRVEAFDGPQQPEIAFFDQVLQTESLSGVTAGDVNDQSQVCTNHSVAGHHVALSQFVQPIPVLLRPTSSAVSLISRRYVSKRRLCRSASRCSGCSRLGGSDFRA